MSISFFVLTIFLPVLSLNVLRRVTLMRRTFRRRRLAFLVSLTVAFLLPAAVRLELPLPIRTGLAATIISFLAALRAISSSNFTTQALLQLNRTRRPLLTTLARLVFATENETASA